MSCVPVIMYPGIGSYYKLEGYANPNEITSATLEFVLNECSIPDEVSVDQVFDLIITYRVCTIEKRNPEGALDNFGSFYDGIFFYKHGLFKNHLRYWVWRLSELIFLPPGVGAETRHGRANFGAGTKFVYVFHGTIEELLGCKITESQTVDIVGKLYGRHYGWYEPDDLWPYNWDPPTNFLEYTKGPVVEVSKTILVTIPPPPPPPPYLVFNLDLCSVSKTTVAPDEKFDILVTIENQNEGGGNYSIGCFCEGKYLELAADTIGEYAAKSHTFRVTANQLAQRSIETSQYLAFTIAVFNNEGETDRWTPAAIGVIVTAPPETASLSGVVSDKQTALALAGASVGTEGYSTSTDSSGYYSFEGLTPGPYEIKFSKSGYWEEIKSITLYAGQNTLNLAMTPTTEPPPSEFPWALVGIGTAGVVALVLILAGRRKNVRGTAK